MRRGAWILRREVIELFATRNVERANELAAKLDRLNRERRDEEARALVAIDALLAPDGQFGADELLVVDGEGWHRGVIGISGGACGGPDREACDCGVRGRWCRRTGRGARWRDFNC